MDSTRMQDSKSDPNVAQPAQASLPSVIAQELQGRSLGQAAFWRFRHPSSAPILGQVPFLFWLTELTEPRLIVQLGLGDGVGYMAFCQAAERLNNGTLCFALTAGASTMSADLHASHDANYSDFSQIISDGKVISQFANGSSIDLLIINRELDKEALTVLRDDVLPCLSDQAVVVIVDPDQALADLAARRIVLNENQLHMIFGPVASDGVAVQIVLHGKTHSERLRRLIIHQPGQSSWLGMRQAFNRLGEGLIAAHQNRELAREKAELQSRIEQFEASANIFGAEVDKALELEKAELQRQADLAAKIYDQQQAIEATENARSLLEAERDELTRKLSALADDRGPERDVTVHLARIAELERSLDEARAEYNERVEDIAILTHKYQADLKEAEKRSAELISLAAATDKRIAAIERNLSSVTAHRDELLMSTSWKITSPLRKMTKVVRGY